MANAPVELKSTSAVQRSFSARYELQFISLTSQTADHHFFNKVASTVKDVTTSMTEEFSRILQVDALSWSAQITEAFAQCSGIKLVLLEQWRGACSDLASATANYEETSKMVVKAKEMESKFSGTLWGSKTGYEKEHDHYKEQLKAAQANQVASMQVKRAELTKSTELGTRLLTACVANAPRIGQSTQFGTKIDSILSKATQEATVALEKHNNFQLEQIQKMQNHLHTLSAIYGK